MKTILVLLAFNFAFAGEPIANDSQTKRDPAQDSRYFTSLKPTFEFKTLDVPGGKVVCGYSWAVGNSSTSSTNTIPAATSTSCVFVPSK